MKNSYLEFCNKYKEKLKNDQDIEIEKAKPNYCWFHDYTDRINFYLAMEVSCPTSSYMTLHGSSPFCRNAMFRLDSEDLQYLYNKYSKRLKDEMEENIEAVKKAYEQ